MATKIDKMVDTAIAIAKDDSHGYSQDMEARWNDPDFDCATLMYYCANKAGYDVTVGPAGTHYTGTMINDFQDAGFRLFTYDGNLSDLDKGDILLRDPWGPDGHTEMYVGNGKLVGAHASESGTAYGKPGDQTGNEISICNVYDPGWDYVLMPPEEKSSSKPSQKPSGKLFGIDVSSNQPKRIVRDVANDFAIVKMCGNPPTDGNGNPLAWNYVNEHAKQQASDAVSKHGLLGLYHLTYGKQAEVEAEFFVKCVKELGYLGKAMLVIDYEDDALNRGQTWVNKLAKRVEELAGYKPVIYAQGSAITSQNLFSLGFPIWCANYYRGYESVYGYDTSGMSIYGGCEKAVMWQFTSQGFLGGYDGPLDLDEFFGTAADFKALMGPQGASGGGSDKPSAKLEVDGAFGPKTKSELQRQLGVKVTGKFDKATIKALQGKVGVKADGIYGPKTKAAYRRKLGLPENATAKTTVKALQRALNAGRVAGW